MYIKRMAYAIAGSFLLLLPGCAADSPSGTDAGKGSLSLQVTVDDDVQDAVPAMRSSQASITPDVYDMNLRLAKTDGSYAETWQSLTDFPSDKQFNVGAYTLEAFYGTPDAEGFDTPYFYGITDVHVAEGSENHAEVTASLANTMVSIDYTDAFRNFFKTYSVQAHSEGGDFISFMSDETRPAYLRPGNITITVSITKQNGLSASIEAATFQASARHHYHLTLDVNNGEVGDGMLQVIFDDSIVTEDVFIDISDEVLLTPAPTVKTGGFSDDQTLYVNEGEALPSASMTISAPAGLGSVVLTTQSYSLAAKGFPAEIDLMAATPGQQALLKSFGLEVTGLYNRPDKMAVIDFSKVTVNTVGAEALSFALVAKDKLGKVNLPAILNVQTKEVNTSIISLPDIRIDAVNAEMTVHYEGSGFSSKAGIQYQQNGSWHNADITAITDEGDNKYRLNFNVPADHTDFPVRLTVSGNRKADATLKKTGVILSAAPADVWATHATFSVRKNSAIPLLDLRFYTSTDGTVYRQVTNTSVNSDGTVTLSGLTPGTHLYVKGVDTGSVSDAYRACQITTESKLALPNPDMETWYEKSGASHWSTWFAGSDENAQWGTNNVMTSSQGGNYAYCRISGTIRSSDHSSGSYSALIRTVGWGKGNTAIGSTSGVCKYVDTGLLHLGPSPSANDHGNPLDQSGISFTSRPSAISFSYKYSPKNSQDYGNILIYVYDASGRTIASASRNLTAVNSFTHITLPITYTRTDAKAARIYVKFVSTVEDRFLVKDELTPPKFALSGGTWMGSQLFIDDINLDY